MTNIKKVKSIKVQHKGRNITKINELEVVGDKILANVFIDIRNSNEEDEYYNGDQILVIDPKTGNVEKIIYIHIDKAELYSYADKEFDSLPPVFSYACPPDASRPGKYMCRDRHFAMNGVTYNPEKDLVFTKQSQ